MKAPRRKQGVPHWRQRIALVVIAAGVVVLLVMASQAERESPFTQTVRQWQETNRSLP